MPDMKKASY